MKQCRAKLKSASGYTLVEIVVVMLIISVLASVSVRSLKGANEVAKIEKTKQILTRLACAISGNPDLAANGMRVDFGYVGDVGALPPDLDALVNNPGFATWRGPYIYDELSAGGSSTNFRKDAWGRDVVYTDVTLTSNGGGTLQRSFARSTNDLLNNRVFTSVLDLAHTPPGYTYKDSVHIILSYPNGAGGLAVRNRYPDVNGFVQFDSIPVGLHELRVVYTPTADTLTRKLCIEPGKDVYTEIDLFRKLW